MNKRLKISIITLVLAVATTTNSVLAQSISVKNSTNIAGITYKQGLEASQYALDGLKFSLDKKSVLPLKDYNYATKSSDNTIDLLCGLSTVSAYMSTGETDYLDIAKRTADFININMGSSNLIFSYNVNTNSIDENFKILAGSNGQASALEYVSYLARIDSYYIPLMNKLANGLITNCINPKNNLAWFQINASTGQAVNSSTYGYESQLGSESASCAQALLCAYETDESNTAYKDKALSILTAIWRTRNTANNLISESYDVKNNKVGLNLYPYSDFRYDDMGGAYIRALTMAYLITKDKTLYDIANSYIPALINNIWDTSINGGAFRYLTCIDGSAKSSTVETMHGLFIGTLLEANTVFYGGKNKDIITKCATNAANTIMDDYMLKNGMSAHLVDNNGNYVSNTSHSQLNYTVIQYPIGYAQLSQVLQDDKYRLCDNTILKLLFERSKMGDNKTTPQGYSTISDTTAPYGFDSNYSTPLWMKHIMFVPLYLLYNSVHTSKNVTIDWYHGTSPGVFGLDSDMPYWDINAVNITTNDITFNNITGEGTVDFSDLGYDITGVEMDGTDYSEISNNILSTQPGSHSYKITLNK